MKMLSALLGLVSLVSGNRLRIVFSSVGHIIYIEFNIPDPYFLFYLSTL